MQPKPESWDQELVNRERRWRRCFQLREAMHCTDNRMHAACWLIGRCMLTDRTSALHRRPRPRPDLSLRNSITISERRSLSRFTALNIRAAMIGSAWRGNQHGWSSTVACLLSSWVLSLQPGLIEGYADRARLPGQGLCDCTRLNNFIPFILTRFISGFEDKNSTESVSRHLTNTGIE